MCRVHLSSSNAAPVIRRPVMGRRVLGGQIAMVRKDRRPPVQVDGQSARALCQVGAESDIRGS